MAEFIISIAETPISVSSQFVSTPEYLKEYLTDAPAEFFMEITEADRRREQQYLDEEADREGLRRRVFTEPFLERAVIQRKTAALLLHKNVLLLHGSTLAVDGRAYLFTAKTGVGKSTHTRLWREMLGERAMVVNDDRAFLRIENGVTAFGSPWSGKHGLDSNISVPLAGICILERGKENCIFSVTAENALPELVNQAFFPADDSREQAEELTARLVQSVPLWRMVCTKEPEAARVAFDAMSKNIRSE